MGQKTSKKAPAAPKTTLVAGSEEWYWARAEELFAPISSRTEFCARFNVKSEAYQLVVDSFEKRANVERGGQKFIDREGWVNVPFKLPELKECLLMIFDAFDADHNGVISLDEYLVYMGVKTFGTPEQKVMGAFLIYDSDNDHKINREEMKKIFKLTIAVAKEYVPDKVEEDISDEDITEAAGAIFDAIDTDHSGTLEMREVVKAARESETISGLFKTM